MVVVFLCTYVPTVQYSTVQYSTVQYSTVQYSTVVLYMCSKQEHKVDHGHKKGHAPRAQEGRSPTGISRPRTEVLRTRAYFSAANTLLRSRASRGHPNLYGSLFAENIVCVRCYSLRPFRSCACNPQRKDRAPNLTSIDNHRRYASLSLS